MRHLQVDFWEGKYLVQNVEVREGQRWTLHCLEKGPYFKDLVLNKDLFGILGP